jgi:hypothetical protein
MEVGFDGVGDDAKHVFGKLEENNSDAGDFQLTTPG